MRSHRIAWRTRIKAAQSHGRPKSFGEIASGKHGADQILNLQLHPATLVVVTRLKIIIDFQDHILSITMNRPLKKNALTAAMYSTMAEALEMAETDMSVRVIIFQGVDGIFTSGNDLADFLGNPVRGTDTPVSRFLFALARSTVPMIAAVDGPAVGIGTTMLLHCDMVIAADTSLFMMPFTNLGLLPENGSSYLLPKIMGHTKASELILTGRAFTAEEALSYGVINEVCKADELVTITAKWAALLASKPPSAMRKSKALMKTDMPVVIDRIRIEMEQFSEALVSPEAKEALTAFMEKRPPDFSKF